ncbi:MAG: HAD family hydrolase [bacterium]|nr:HAD family hydrolase [bacterium]
MSNNKKAVVFDLDGTLINTLEDLAASMNAVLEKRGFPVFPVEQYKKLIGDGVEILAERVLPEGKKEERLIKECAEDMKQEYDRKWKATAAPYPGIPELLTGLEERGIRMAVLTNKPHEFTEITITTFLPHWNFEILLGARSEVPRKPHPAGAFEIIERMSLSPDEFYYLGDTNTDMKTAVAAGMYPVGVLWGFRDAEELMESGAKKLLERPEELLDMLDAGE